MTTDPPRPGTMTEEPRVAVWAVRVVVSLVVVLLCLALLVLGSLHAAPLASTPDRAGVIRYRLQ